MDSWIIWLIVAVALVALEIMTQMVWTLCLAVGCVAALVADLCGASTPWQIAVMAIAAVIAFIVLMPLFKRWHDTTSHHSSHAATGMDALIGRRARLTADVTPDRPGRVRIDGDNWQATSADPGLTIPAGTEITVRSYDGNILHVTPLS